MHRLIISWDFIGTIFELKSKILHIKELKGVFLKRFIYIFLATWLYGDIKFEDLISKAVNNYPSIKMSEEAFKMSEEEVKNAIWQYFPTPSVDLSRSSKNNELVAKIEQPLWTGGRLDAQYDLAVSARSEAGYLIEENKFKLIEKILNLLQIYSQGKSAEKSLQEGYNRLSKFSEMLDNRFESGMSSLSDKKLLNSRLTQIKSELINAKAKQHVSLKQLSLLVGEKIDKVDFDLNKFYFEDNHANLLTDNMIKYHPSLSKLDEQIKASIYEVDKEQAALYPTISLTAEHTSGNVYDKESNDSNNAVYLSLRASTGAGLSILSKIEKAKVNTKKLQAEKNLKEKELSDSILTDYNNMLIAKEKIDNLKENKELSAEIFESNKRLFIAGRKQWLDLVNSSKELMDISVSHQETKELYIILKYKIALQTGLINTSTGDIQDNKNQNKIVNNLDINNSTEENELNKKVNFISSKNK